MSRQIYSKPQIKLLATMLRKHRRIWQGYPEATAAMDGLIIDLAKKFAALSPKGFSVQQWIEKCGSALVMGWLPRSIALDMAARTANAPAEHKTEGGA